MRVQNRLQRLSIRDEVENFLGLFRYQSMLEKNDIATVVGHVKPGIEKSRHAAQPYDVFVLLTPSELKQNCSKLYK